MIPSIIVTNSSTECPPDTVVKGILNVEELSSPIVLLPEVLAYPWDIDTKYYTTTVHVCSLDTKSIGTREFGDTVNAVIIPFDSQSGHGLSAADQWLSFMSEFDAEVKILICNSCVANDVSQSQRFGVSKLEAQRWCLKNGFELVELFPTDVQDDDSEVEDDFVESTGIKRVVQALHAHVWPNLELKAENSRSVPGSVDQLQHALNRLSMGTDNVTNGGYEGNGDHSSLPMKKKLIAEVKPTLKADVRMSNVAIVSPLVSPTNDVDIPEVTSVNGAAAGENGESSTSTGPNPTARDERIDTMLGALDTMPEDTFEELLQSLQEMRKEADRLSPTHRKEYAEKMAVAFWKSIGGNDSEIEGLSSDEEESS